MTAGFISAAEPIKRPAGANPRESHLVPLSGRLVSIKPILTTSLCRAGHFFRLISHRYFNYCAERLSKAWARLGGRGTFVEIFFFLEEERKKIVFLPCSPPLLEKLNRTFVMKKNSKKVFKICTFLKVQFYKFIIFLQDVSDVKTDNFY